MVEIGRVGVKAGNATIELKISAYPHKPTSNGRQRSNPAAKTAALSSTLFQ
jgi:hypothetical protein